MRQPVFVLFALILAYTGTAFANDLSDLKVPTNVYLTAGEQRQMQRNGYKPTGDSNTYVATRSPQTYSGSGAVPVNVYLTPQQNRAQQTFVPSPSTNVVGFAPAVFSPTAAMPVNAAVAPFHSGMSSVIPADAPRVALTGSSVVTPNVQGAVVPYQNAGVQGIMENLNVAVSSTPVAVRAQFSAASAPAVAPKVEAPMVINTGVGSPSAYVVSIKPYSVPNASPTQAIAAPVPAGSTNGGGIRMPIAQPDIKMRN